MDFLSERQYKRNCWVKYKNYNFFCTTVKLFLTVNYTDKKNRC